MYQFLGEAFDTLFIVGPIKPSFLWFSFVEYFSEWLDDTLDFMSFS